MPTYTPIIKYLLLWQLALPVLMLLAGMGWLWALFTGVLFATLYYKHQSWESNSYSRYGALAVVISSLLYAMVNLTYGGLSVSGLEDSALSLIPYSHTCVTLPWPEYGSLVVWLFSMIAFTATSPYPLGIRMPVVVYTVFYFLVGPDLTTLGSSWLVIVALVFACMMLFNLILWKRQAQPETSSTVHNTNPSISSDSTDVQTTDNGVGNSPSSVLTGPAEPPFSFSLATAIVSILVIALMAGVLGLFWKGALLDVLPLIMVSGIIIWVLCAKDWKKNILAQSALVLILISNCTSIVALYTTNHPIGVLAFVLLIAPVVFHTTAPVFRGMRITITLYATYNAFCKSTINQYIASWSSSETLTATDIQNIAFIAFDTIVLTILILMALHWKGSQALKLG